MRVHVGVDQHKRFCQVAVLQPGHGVTQVRVGNELGAIRGLFRKIPAPAKIAIEATGTWWWLVDELERLGHEPVLSHPKQTKAIASARLKNDKVDAERLAHLLQADLLPTVWIPRAKLREARELIRHRMSLVRLRTGVKNQIHALLARRNLRPAGTTRWTSVSGRRQMQQLRLSPEPATVLDNCLRLLRLLDEQIRALDTEILRRWGQHPTAQRLRSIPGVGPFLSVLLLLEVGDIERFPSAKHLASYIGLTPRVRQSGDRAARHGHISKEGNRCLRWAMVVAATIAARRPGPLRAWYRRLASRKGAKIARVALARRLTEIVYQVWKNDMDYLEVLRRDVQG